MAKRPPLVVQNDPEYEKLKEIAEEARNLDGPRGSGAQGDNDGRREQRPHGMLSYYAGECNIEGVRPSPGINNARLEG